MLAELFRALRNFVIGLIKRIYWIIPAIASDPFDITERWFGVNYTAPQYIFWILLFVGFFIASFLTFYDLHKQKIALDKSSNWIDEHKRKYRNLPEIPNFMSDLISGYCPGMVVSKNIQLITPSVQYWNKKLLPSQRKMILDLIEWLGQDRRDYKELIQRMAPPGNTGRFRIASKR